MFASAPIHDTESKGKWEPLPKKLRLSELEDVNRTRVYCVEFHLSQTCHEGLHKLQVEEYKKAAELLESVLKDPLIENT